MNEKLSFQHIAEALSQKGSVQKKVAESFVKSFFDTVAEAVKNGEDSVKIDGWGTFKRVSVDSRESVNVSNGERILIQGYTKLAFSPEDTVVAMLSRSKKNSKIEEADDDCSLDKNDVSQESDLSDGVSCIDTNEILPGNIEHECFQDDIVEEDESPFVELAKDDFSGIDMIISTPESLNDVHLQLEEAKSKVAEAIEMVKKASAEKARLERLLERLEKNIASEEVGNHNLYVGYSDENEHSVQDDEQLSKSEDACHDDSACLMCSDDDKEGAHLDGNEQHDGALQRVLYGSDDGSILREGASGEGGIEASVSKDSSSKSGRKWLISIACILLSMVLVGGIGYLVYGTFLSIESVEKVPNLNSSKNMVHGQPEMKPSKGDGNSVGKSVKNNDELAEKPQIDNEVCLDVQNANDGLNAKTDKPSGMLDDAQQASASSSKQNVVSDDKPLRPKTYTLKKGETLTRVSQRFYGTKDSVCAIIRVNTFVNPDNVPIGAVITLP